MGLAGGLSPAALYAVTVRSYRSPIGRSIVSWGSDPVSIVCRTEVDRAVMYALYPAALPDEEGLHMKVTVLIGDLFSDLSGSAAVPFTGVSR